jgi:branched-chain amino acid transport system permease protein
MLSQILLDSLIAGSIYALVALGFGLVYSTAGFFHFAHGAVYAAGAYLVFSAWSAGLSLYFAVPLAIVGGMLIGMLMEIGIYRPLRRKRASNLTLLIASLGMFIVGQNLISLIFGDDTKTLRTGLVSEGIPILGARLTKVQLGIITSSVLLIGCCWFLLKKTKIGRAMRAVADDPQLAAIRGINVDRVILFAFAVGSALVVTAATLVALDSDMTPMMGFYALLVAVVAVIAGGIGSIPGAALGGLLIGAAEQLGAWRLPTEWQQTIVFSILILFLTFRPQGFLGRSFDKPGTW